MYRIHRFYLRTVTLILAALVLAPAAATAQAWLDSYDEGLGAARESERPLVLFITAPGWCEPCERFEAQVFSDDLVGDILRKEFVTVWLTDRDPEHARFEFPGYPSFLVFHPSGRRLGAFHAPESIRELRAELDRYQRPLPELLAAAEARAADAGGTADASTADPGTPGSAAAIRVPTDTGEPADTAESAAAERSEATEPAAASAAGARYRYPGGVFIRRDGGSWLRVAGGERTQFSEYREDDRYAYLKPSEDAGSGGETNDERAGSAAQGEEGFFAIPRDGGQAFRWNAEREAWESAWQVTAPEDE